MCSPVCGKMEIKDPWLLVAHEVAAVGFPLCMYGS